MFSDRVLIFSNSAGSSDDRGFTQAAEIEAELRIAVLKHNEKVCLVVWYAASTLGMCNMRSAWSEVAERTCGGGGVSRQKPGGIEHVEAHFHVDPATLVMIGDRYSTDVLFGNLHGTIHVHTPTSTGRGCDAQTCVVTHSAFLFMFGWCKPRGGLFTIRTDQFTREGESAVNTQLQRVEKVVVRLLERAGVTAPAHPLLPDANAVTKYDHSSGGETPSS